jgi:hypothetical protein
VTEQPDLPPSFTPGSYRRPTPRDQEKAETKRMGIIVLSIVGLLVAVVLARSLMVARAPNTTASDASGTPVIGADKTPTKSAPANPGGMQVPGADQEVLAGSGGNGAANGQLAPTPEAPAPDKLASSAPAPPVPATPTAPTPTAAPPAVAAPPASPDAVPAPVPVKAAHTAPPEHKHARAETHKPAHEDAEAAPSGEQEVQFGALTSKAEALAEWKHLKAALPALLHGHKPLITTVDHNGHTLYRLRTGGFADHAAARKFCSKVKEQGHSCLLF